MHSTTAKVLRPEWVAAAAEIGNKKAKAFWENRLPEEKRPALDASPSGRAEEWCVIAQCGRRF